MPELTNMCLKRRPPSRSRNVLAPSARLFICVIVLLSIVNCEPPPPPPQIVTFHVRPLFICGERAEVRIDWEAGLEVTLSADTEVSPRLPGAVEMTGNTTVVINSTTVFTLTASSEGHAAIERTITVTLVPPEGIMHEFIAAGSCAGGVPTWRIDVPAEEWDDSVTVRSVTNTTPGARHITVSHGPMSIGLPPGMTATTPSRTRVNGRWTLSTALTTPSCSVQTSELPTLTIRIRAGCE